MSGGQQGFGHWPLSTPALLYALHLAGERAGSRSSHALLEMCAGQARHTWLFSVLHLSFSALLFSFLQMLEAAEPSKERRVCVWPSSAGALKCHPPYCGSFMLSPFGGHRRAPDETEEH